MKFGELMKAQKDIMQGIHDAAMKDGREYTEEEQTKYNNAEKEFKRLKAAKDQSDALAAMDNDIPEPDTVPKPASNSSAAANKVKAGKDLRTEKPYAHIGETLVDVKRATLGNGLALDTLKNANINTETGVDGGFLIANDFITSMMNDAMYQSQLYSRVTEFNVSGNSANIPGVDETSRADGSRAGGIQFYWIREGGEITYTKPTFKDNDLKLSKIAGIVSVTTEMLEDATFLASWVKQKFPEEMAFSLDQAVFDGDGNGKPLGILNAPSLVTVAKETSQTADTIVFENVVKMWARMPFRRQKKAVWFITEQAQEQLPLMNLSVGTGGVPVYMPANGAVGAPFSTLFTRPVIPIENATALGDLGDIFLADLSDYVSIVKGGLRVDSSIHVEFAKDLQAFRFIKRMNGMPYQSSAIAARANSSFTTSPYVTLAERAA